MISYIYNKIHKFKSNTAGRIIFTLLCPVIIVLFFTITNDIYIINTCRSIFSPDSAILHQITFKLIFSLAIMIILLGLIIVWCSKSLYLPWKNLADAVNQIHTDDIKKEDAPSKIEDYLMNSFSNIININKTLKQNLTVTLPLSQEKYLIDILNNDINESSSAELLSPLSFKYDFFVSISININVDNTFFSDTGASPSQTKKEIYKVIRSFFSNTFITYELPSTNNVLYLLLNLENDECVSEIDGTINKIKDMFALETDKIDFIFGIGNIYKGLYGLKATHNEAISNMKKQLYSHKIKVFPTQKTEYTYNTNSKNILYNYVNAGYSDKAEIFIKNIFKELSNDSIENRNKVYKDLLSSLQMLMKDKGIDYPSVSEKIAPTSISDFSEGEIQSFILNQLDIIIQSLNVSAPKLNVDELIEYINEHYTEDMYLERLAEKYSTSTKYLSKRIKQHLNMTFKEYLTQLRINKAKELLQENDIKISDLYMHVGFQNRSVFIRAFKLKVGLTPSEYKKTYARRKK